MFYTQTESWRRKGKAHTDTHTHTSFEWWTCKRVRVAMVEMRWVSSTIIVLWRDTSSYCKVHTYSFGSDKGQDGTSHWIGINIWPGKYLHTPLIRGNRWPQGLWTMSVIWTNHRVLAVFPCRGRREGSGKTKRKDSGALLWTGLTS